MTPYSSSTTTDPPRCVNDQCMIPCANHDHCRFNDYQSSTVAVCDFEHPDVDGYFVSIGKCVDVENSSSIAVVLSSSFTRCEKPGSCKVRRYVVMSPLQ